MNRFAGQVAEIIGKDRFHLFYMDANLEYCKNNKPGLYQKAEKGEIENLPGVDMEYEVPAKCKNGIRPGEKRRKPGCYSGLSGGQ